MPRQLGDLMIKVEDAWAPANLVAQARGVQAELGWSLRPEETGGLCDRGRRGGAPDLLRGLGFAASDAKLLHRATPRRIG